MSRQFSDRLLAWFKKHGRHDLPWQVEQTPYCVWVSEIMLQQTQVVTVIPYFERFMETFPDVESLAKANLDNVLHHWTGLGYYARARNLHKASNIIVEKYQGIFPASLDKVMALPGIGRSTAGAILSLACEQRQPILDGNVKRVLSRYHGIEGWPGQKKVEQELWTYAEQHMPTESVRDYTQAIMDLGATICVRRNPDCHVCPLTRSCYARKSERQHDFPGSKPKKTRPNKETVFAIIENVKGEVLLQQRPPSGIWGGLWCFPEFSLDDSIASEIKKQYGLNIKQQTEYKHFKHTFSHFNLMIKPVHIKLAGQDSMVCEDGLSTWINPGQDSNLGFPAPVVSMLQELNNNMMVIK
ncbi:MAG: A/G-specific adenine glycosylase [Proteobacteria bacterium]|nr:adenine DNA glycosylase [Pseudomonadota bacterium]NOG60427.1 A/G-specific adenine glycosylase [Pseudomonadota bacterium]